MCLKISTKHKKNYQAFFTYRVFKGPRGTWEQTRGTDPERHVLPLLPARPGEVVVHPRYRLPPQQESARPLLVGDDAGSGGNVADGQAAAAPLRTVAVGPVDDVRMVG